MPYLNLDLDYFEHRKTCRLIGLLGKGAEVLPIKLWRYCGKFHAEDGRLAGYTDQEVETAVGWWGEPGKAVSAMLTIGFLEKADDGYQVHDWIENQGHIAAFKRKGREMAMARWGHADSNAYSITDDTLEQHSQQCHNQPTKPTKPTKPKKQKPGAVAPGQESPLRELTNYFTQQWQTKYGKPYPFRKLDGVKSAELLKACGGSLEDAKTVIDRYLADDGKFYGGHPIALLTSAAQLPRFMTDRAVASNAKQPTAVDRQMDAFGPVFAELDQKT